MNPISSKINLLVIGFLLLQSSTFIDVLQEAIALDVVAITRVVFQICVAGLIQFFLSRVYVKYKNWKTNDVFFKELAVKQSEIDTLKELVKSLQAQQHRVENNQHLQQGEINMLTQIIMSVIPENPTLKKPDEDGGIGKVS